MQISGKRWNKARRGERNAEEATTRAATKRGNTWKYVEIRGNTWKYVEIRGRRRDQQEQWQ
jgi:hypothetical protein